MFRKQPLSPVF